MDLQTFVEHTVLSIVRGVDAARRAPPGIAPPIEMPGDDDKVEGVFFTDTKTGLQPVFMVEFDVAVTATDKKATDAGGGIRVLEFIRADAKRSSESQGSTVSRIQFKIPVRLT